LKTWSGLRYAVEHEEGKGITGVDRMAVAFSRLLRGAGLDVPIGSVATFAAALGTLGIDRRHSVYWAGRSTLVRRPEDVAVYDRVFDAFWLGWSGGSRAVVEDAFVLALDSGDERDGENDEDEPGPQLPTIAVRYSPMEVLREKSFAAYSRTEFDESRRLMADMRLRGELRRSRRLRPVRRASGRIDLRRTARRSLRFRGEPVRRAWLAPSDRPRRVVLLCDVSGSMEPYARALLRFLHAAVVGRGGSGRVEAFVFGTRLTRITRELSWRDPDAALADAARAVSDWSGGTRIGEGLATFNNRWGVRGMARNSVIVIMSDGWDRGDPDVLAAEMARLARVAHRVVWVNPLKASPGYAPLARGMAAALPYVDDFVEGHSIASLADLAEVVAGRDARGRPARKRGRR
jgi:uncharacterized protein with von Willebrand factor type A (vWA) domain